MHIDTNTGYLPQHFPKSLKFRTGLENMPVSLLEGLHCYPHLYIEVTHVPD